MKLSRRQFLKSTLAASALVGAGGIGTLLTPHTAHAIASSPNLVKWNQAIRGLKFYAGFPLPGDPNGIPVLQPQVDPVFTNTDYYEVTAGEFQDTLHSDLGGPTTLWGYYATTNPDKKHLGGIVIASRGKPVRMRFTNSLPPTHIIPVDTTIPGAEITVAQNRIAIHQHGGLVPWTSDGGPFDWWQPNGTAGLSFPNGPGGFLDLLYPSAERMVPGQADYYYPNDASTRLVWYHDHAHGITRLNAYAGLASAYLILDSTQEAALAGKIPSIASTLPLVFQDKIFVHAGTFATDPTWASVAPASQAHGSLWYEHIYDPKAFRLLKSQKYLVPPNPSAIPEFFGDTMLCNGTVYPLLTVEPKAYRFVILNACNARFLNINLLSVAAGQEVVTNPKTLFANLAVNPPGPPIIQIGTEGGYLAREVTYPNNLPFNPAIFKGNLLLGPAERADIIIDFTGIANGTEFMMYNDAPGPFPAGPPTTDFYLGNPKNPVQPLPGTGPDTRQILRIRVQGSASTTEPRPVSPILTNLVEPAPLSAFPALPTNAPIPSATAILPLAHPTGAVVKDLTLNEDFDNYGRLRQLLGTTAPGVLPGFGREYLEPATEIVANGATEVWRVFNLTADTHPIHFHLVNVQVLYRQPFKVVAGVFTPTGVPRGPEPGELGWKETVQMHPGEMTAVAMKWDLPPVPFTVPFSKRLMGGAVGAPALIPNANEFVWHCHILEHEEHDMMRPLVVTGANPVAAMTIAPASVTVASYAVNGAGKTFEFVASNGIKPIAVTANDASFPAVLTPDGNGFAVTLPTVSPPVTTPYTATYTISDGSTPAKTATATLIISAA